MLFDPKEYLNRLIEARRLPQCLLLSGSGLRDMGLDIAKRWLQAMTPTPVTAFVDLHCFTPDSKMGLHTVEAIERLRLNTAILPYEAAAKAFVIDDAERMLPTAASALLKSIEEPHPTTWLLLLSSRPDMLLPTIRSRCQQVRFALAEVVPRSEIGAFLGTWNGGWQPLVAFCSGIQQQLVCGEGEEASWRWMRDVEQLLVEIYSWYRQQGAQLDRIETATAQAKLALERSTPLQTVLEGLLMRAYHAK